MTVRKQKKSYPKYQVHKATRRAFIWWRNKRHYLGAADSPESFEAYNRFIAEIARTNGLYDPQPKSALSGSNNTTTIGALMVAYLAKVQSELSPKEFDNTKYSFRPLRKLFEHASVDKFGPKALKQVRQAMIDSGLTRKVINQRIGRIKRLFKFGVAEELVPPSVYHALQAVEGLRYGRSEAPETEPVQPVDDTQIALLLPFLSGVVRAMLILGRLSGARPGEVCRMRLCDIDRSGDIWLYRPFTLKTKWRGKERIIPLGPQAQEVLRPFIDRPETAYLFTPQESSDWLRNNPMPDKPPRKTPVYPSELQRREKYKKTRRNRRFRPCFSTDSYDRSIVAAIERARKAGVHVEHIAPNQARHARATEIRRDHGLEAAQVSLGHAKANVTQVYAERDLQKAIEIARKSG